MAHMTNTPPHDAKLLPIKTEDLQRVCHFYHTHLNQKISPQMWRQAFDQPWIASPPNHGFMLVANGEVVGVFGAIYSAQRIGGAIEQFCNHTSWMVLEPYRARSLELLTALLSQQGFHMTSFTPNPNVTEICCYLGLNLLSNQITVLPIFLGGWRFNSRVITNPEKIPTLLPTNAVKDYQNHRPFPWLRQVALGHADRYCHVAFKQKRWKRMAAAMILHISDPEIFLAHYPTLGRHLFWRFGITTLHLPSRFLPRNPTGSIIITENQPRLFRADSLGQEQISFLYTEVVALDLPL